MNWIKRFRKLNIKVQVALLCVICLVASLGLNVFRHKSMTVSAGDESSLQLAPGMDVYLDLTGFTEWKDADATMHLTATTADGSTSQRTQFVEVTEDSELYKATIPSGSSEYTKIKFSRRSSDGNTEWNYTADYTINQIPSGTNTYKMTGWGTQPYLNGDWVANKWNGYTLAGKNVYFKNLNTAGDISELTVVFSSDDNSIQAIVPASEVVEEDGYYKVTIPEDKDGKAYNTIQFKNGETNLTGKESLMNGNYKSGSTNTFYYGAKQEASNIDSYWGAKRGTQAVNLSKIYFNNLSFPTDSGKVVTVTYDGTTYPLSADSEDATTYSVALTGLTQNKVIEFTYGDTTYRFYADNETYNQVGIEEGYAAFNSNYVNSSNKRKFYYDATLSKLAYTTIDDTSGDYIYFSMKDANSIAEGVGTPKFGYMDNGNAIKIPMESLGDGWKETGYTYRVNVEYLNQNSTFWIDRGDGTGLTGSTATLDNMTIREARGMVFRITEPVYKYENGKKVVDYYPLIAESLMATMPQRYDDNNNLNSSNNMKNIYLRLYKKNSPSDYVDFEMTKLSSYNDGTHTWNDVYEVDIDPTTVNQYDKMIYYSGDSAGDIPNDVQYAYMASRTVALDIPASNSNNCFYADGSDDVIYYKTGKTLSDYYRGGYFDNVYQVRDAETKKGTDTVSVDTQSFTKQNDTIYVHSTFYDYYSDSEIDGKNRRYYDQNEYTSVRGQKNWSTFRHFSQALSDYYSGTNTDIPIYTGHFQPDEFEGTLFRHIAPTLGLYGYADKNSTQHQFYYDFMSANNSKLSNDSGDGTNGNAKNGYYAYASQGLVGNTLGDNDELYTRDKNKPFEIGSNAVSNSTSNLLPHFDKDFLLGNNSKNAVIGDVYEDVAFPFKKKYLATDGSTLLAYNDTNKNQTGITYYSFDSANTTVYLNKVDNTGATSYQYFLKETNNDGRSNNVNSASMSSSNGFSTVSTLNGFFPFNEKSSAEKASTYNYGFGSKLEFDFSLTENGKVRGSNGTEYPITFEFTGDDDVWVFIDGKLVLDTGGSHGRVSGTINFADMKATVSKVKKTAGRDVQGDNITNDFTMSGSKTGRHRLTMFYMERGMWESNMSVRYNFIDNNDLEVTKTIDTSNVMEPFKSLFDSKDFTYNIQNRATHFPSKDADRNQQSNVGFVVQQDQISDYGSISSRDLSNVKDAAYTVQGKSTVQYIGDDGNFVLNVGNETTTKSAMFTNQFRRGSYIGLTEVLTEAERKLYTSTYSISEYDNESGSYKAITSDVLNSTNSTNSTNVQTRKKDGLVDIKPADNEAVAIEDYRTENADANSVSAEYSTGDTTGKSFVFRSFLYPDYDELSLHLRTDFTNKVNTGKISLKKIQSVNSSDDLSSEQKYTFYVVYTNIGGVDLNGGIPIVQKIELTSTDGGNTWEQAGIPVGTEYKIYEAIPTDGSSLDYVDYIDTYMNEEVQTQISAGKSTVENLNTQTTVSGDSLVIGTPYVTREVTRDTEETAYTFANKKTELINLDVKKKWTGADGDKLPDSVNFRLVQLSGADYTTENVIKVVYDNTKSAYVLTTDNTQKGLIQLDKPTWEAKVVNLPKTFKVGSETLPYKYKLIEVLDDGAENITEYADDATIKFNPSSEDGFKVSYVNATATAYDETPTATVTNTYVPAPYRLPVTGGAGTEGFSVVGIGLMILAMVGLVFVNRKKLMEYL